MNEQQLAEAVYRVGSMGADISEIKGAIRDLAVAVGRLAVIEERQSQDRESLGRAHNRLDEHDGRIKTIELAAPITAQTNTWVHKAIMAAAGAVMSIVIYRAIEGPNAPVHAELPGATIGGKP